MDDDGRQQAFLTALTTEHFVLQTASATTVNEANGRSALYLSSVSSALVALGFVAQTGDRFDALAAAVLPALFILGEFTFVRLLQLSLENMLAIRGLERIRKYYRGLSPDADAFFGQREDDARSTWRTTWVMRASGGQVLFTAAGMVAAINAILGGAGATLLLTSAEVANGTAATIVGVVAALSCFAGHVLFQTRQFTAVVPTAADGASSPERLQA